MSNVTSIDTARPSVLEFFAGIGLARMGLEAAGFKVSWANDLSADKRSMYVSQFSQPEHYLLQDIATVSVHQIPSDATLAWASSPCTDLSLAGTRSGLTGSQSGTFWHFTNILESLGVNRPELAVLENVTGLATSHGGDDITAAIRAFNRLGYSVDVLTIDARRFIPQSRPRLFIIGAQNPPKSSNDSSDLRPDSIQWIFEDPTLLTHKAPLPVAPAPLLDGLGTTVEKLSSDDERWWDTDRKSRFVDSLSEIQLQRLHELSGGPLIQYRTAYRRTRQNRAVWEIRPDDISGCLRTARGGSSKQALVEAGRGELRVRWMTPQEYANLMGATEYNLTDIKTNQALFGFGDAVAVPVVSWLADNYLMPLIRNRKETAADRPSLKSVL